MTWEQHAQHKLSRHTQAWIDQCIPSEQLAPVCRDAPFLAEVLTVKELHAPTAERSCIHVELDVTGSDIKYTAGDHVSHPICLCCRWTACALYSRSSGRRHKVTIIVTRCWLILHCLVGLKGVSVDELRRCLEAFSAVSCASSPAALTLLQHVNLNHLTVILP